MAATANDLTADAPDRSVIATRRLCDTLSLGTLKPKDLKALSVALAEAATEEAVHNDLFRQRILTTFGELTQSKTPVAKSRGIKKQVAKKPRPVPIRQVDPTLLGPDKPLDPYLVQFAYGDDQVRAVLELFPVSELKKAAAIVERRQTGTSPTNRSQKGALIDYIVAQLTREALLT